MREDSYLYDETLEGLAILEAGNFFRADSILSSSALIRPIRLLRKKTGGSQQNSLAPGQIIFIFSCLFS